MSRPYIHLAGDLSGWPKGFVLTPAALRKLDQFSSELVNGDEGGEWSPAKPLVIGPHGTPTIILDTAGSVLSGDVETVKGNSLDSSLEAPGLVLQGGAVPTFATPRSRSVSVGFSAFVERSLSATTATDFPFYELDPVTLGAKSIVDNGFGFGNIVDYVLSVPLPFRAQHRGATIDSVDFRMIVGGRIYALPGTMPRYRIIRVTGDTTVLLHSNAGGYDASGWFVDPAATIGDYLNNGQPRTLSFVPDQNNAALDPSTGFYVVQARLATLGSIMLSATVNLSAIADMQQE